MVPQNDSARGIVVAVAYRSHGRDESGVDESPPEGHEVNCDPWSDCRIVVRRSGWRRRVAMPSASMTSSVRMLSPTDQPTTLRE